MYALYDTFNHRVVSRHRSVDAVVTAELKLQRKIEKQSPGCFLPTTIRAIVRGELIKLHEDSPEWSWYLYHPERG
jgi:hypothetical protein